MLSCGATRYELWFPILSFLFELSNFKVNIQLTDNKNIEEKLTE